ncbi:hypothetical protein PMAYCL1PPCAC_27146, partial [Pristionchus mayeri]
REKVGSMSIRLRLHCIVNLSPFAGSFADISISQVGDEHPLFLVVFEPITFVICFSLQFIFCYDYVPFVFNVQLSISLMLRMNNHSSSAYSNRSNRSRTKQPVYTSDKRARLTQRDNKKWLRLLTVFGYVVFVSAPAISLSVYYTCVWDPMYIEKYNQSRLQAIAQKQQLKPQTKPKRALADEISNLIIDPAEKNKALVADISNIPVEEKKCICKEGAEEKASPTILAANGKIKDQISLETLLKQHASERDLSVSSESELLSSSTESKSSESKESHEETLPLTPA